jgi:hypothetical protein
LGESIQTVKNTEALSVPSKEIGLEANAGKDEYMLMSHEKNAEQNHNMKVGNKSFESMVHSKYLETTLTKIALTGN